MSESLNIIFFGIDSKTQIYPRIPSIQDLSEIILIRKDENKEINITIIDQHNKFEPENENINYVNESFDEWLVDNDFNKIEGDVIVFCLSAEEIDTYTIMEKLETQKYENHYYFNWYSEKQLDIKKYINEWVKKNQGSPSSPRLSSKKNLNLVEHYQLYSGDKITDTISDIDIIAIYNRIILLCDYIRHYLRFGLDRKYNIMKFRTLPNYDEGYTDRPFFNDTESEDMVKNSCYFQIEDPILKGFLLAHELQVESGISPLQIGIELQTIMFNNGQFRRELLTSFMKIVAIFCQNNDLLTGDDFSVAVKKKPTKILKEETTNIVVSKKTSTGIKINPLKISKVETETITVETEKPHKEYFTEELWNLVEERIKEKIEELSE